MGRILKFIFMDGKHEQFGIKKNLSKNFIEGEMVWQINGLPFYFVEFTSGFKLSHH